MGRVSDPKDRGRGRLGNISRALAVASGLNRGGFEVLRGLRAFSGFRGFQGLGFVLVEGLEKMGSSRVYRVVWG